VLVSLSNAHMFIEYLARLRLRYTQPFQTLQHTSTHYTYVLVCLSNATYTHKSHYMCIRFMGICALECDLWVYVH